MHDINLKLWRNDQQLDWSAEINGTRYESVTLDRIEILVQRALHSTDAPASQMTATPRRTH